MRKLTSQGASDFARAMTTAVLVLGVASADPALAQRAPVPNRGAQTAPPPASQSGATLLGKIFDFDLADLLPEAPDKLNAVTPGMPMPLKECPKGPNLKAIVGSGGDPLFLKTLGEARKQTLDGFMRKRGGYYSVEWGFGPQDGNVEVSYGTLPDKEKPTLHVTSQPPKGKKVKAGDKIRIDITASDEANDWQTGIRNIQVLDNNGLFDLQDYAHPAHGGPVSKCEPERRKRTWWTTYTVPRNPPPIVRLTVTTEDFAGNHAKPEIGEFPTGDWHGTLACSSHYTYPEGGFLAHTSNVDLILEYDAQGKLEGRGMGEERQTLSGQGCHSTTVVPGKLQGKVTGIPGRSTMSLQWAMQAYTVGQGSPCNGQPVPGNVGSSLALLPEFQRVLSDLQPSGDGEFRSSAEQDYNGNRVSCSLTLHRTRN